MFSTFGVFWVVVVGVGFFGWVFWDGFWVGVFFVCVCAFGFLVGFFFLVRKRAFA